MSPEISILFLILIIPFLFFCVFLGIWILVIYLISRGGWSALGSRYAYKGKFSGEKVGWGLSGSIGAAAYRGALIIKVNTSGLYIRTLNVFRFYHPPIFIPWSEVKINDPEQAIGSIREYSIGDPPISTIRMDNGTFKKIEKKLLSSLGA